jgi:hypothetical protein
MIKNIFTWVADHNNALSAWSSIITIISLPLAIVGVAIGYIQIKDLLIEPSVELEFTNAHSVNYTVENTSGKMVEDVVVGFGIFDLDSLAPFYDSVLPIPAEGFDYINKNSANGPKPIFHKFGSPGHRYFGILYLTCKGCSSTEYWLYCKQGNPAEAYYAKRTETDTYLLDGSRLATESYLEELVPPIRRIYINR